MLALPPVTPLTWFGLVAVYVALGWWRGASWRAIIGLPVLIMAIVVAEFTVPAVLARTGDLRVALAVLLARLSSAPTACG